MIKRTELRRLFRRGVKQTRLIVWGHMLNWPWLDKKERRRRRYAASRKAVMWYLKDLAPYISTVRVPVNDPEPEAERVFTIWFQGERQAPPLVKACIASMRSRLEQEVVLIDEKNLADWIELPDYILRKWREGKMRAAHFSDICRVELLYRHGGIWLDSTDLVTEPVPRWIMDEDFFIYMAGNKVRESYSFVQNCFFRAKKGNPLLGLWREAIFRYWKEEDSIVNYYAHQLLFKLTVEQNPQAAELFQKMRKVDQDPTHVLWSGHSGDVYSEELFKSLTKGAFFQKTNYKSRNALTPPPESMAEYIIDSIPSHTADSHG